MEQSQCDTFISYNIQIYISINIDKQKHISNEQYF